MRSERLTDFPLSEAIRVTNLLFRKCWNALLLVIVLLVSGGWVVVERMGNGPLIGALCLVLLCGFLGSARIPKSVNGLFVLTVMVLFAVSYLQDMTIDDKELFVILKACIAMAACVHFSRLGIDFRELFVDVMYYTSIVSLILYPLAWAAPGLAIHIDGEYGTLFGLLYVRASDIQRFGHYRNQGFFWEAGVYGVMLSLAYIYNALIYRRRRGWVLLLTALTTASMGALAILVPTAGFLYVYARQPRIATALAVAALLAGIGVVSVPGLADSALSVLTGRNLKNDSSITVRLNDLTLGLRASSDSLMLGRPSDDLDAYNALALSEYGYVKINDSGISNSITSLVYKYGVPLTLMYLLTLASRMRRDFGKLALVVFPAVCGLLMVEPLGVSIFVFMLLAYRPPRKFALKATVGQAPSMENENPGVVILRPHSPTM